MRLRLLLIPFALLAMSLALVACGDDDDDDPGNGDSVPTDAPDNGGDDPTDAPDDGDNGGNGNGGGGGFGSGTGTLTIGDETWEITGVGCVFSAEEARNPDFPFNLAGSAESSTGERLHVAADIYDPSGQERHEGEGVSHHIEIYDLNFEDQTVSWTTIPGLLGGGEDAFITVDGKNVRGEGLFDDDTTEEFEAVPGTLDIQCP